MTITEHLEFSVLSAPVAAVDRRALSQAWFSALYGASTHVPQANVQTSAPPLSAAEHCDVTVPESLAIAQRREPEMRARPTEMRETRSGSQIERRAPRSPLARKIERAFLRPYTRARKASFEIGGAHGRVQVLLRTQGSQLRLVAICPPKARAYVVRALAQARYALALRGLDLHSELRDAVKC